MGHLEESIHSFDLPYVENLYARFLRDPADVPEDWRAFFESLPKTPEFRTAPSFKPASIFHPAAALKPEETPVHTTINARDTAIPVLQQRVDELIHAYRQRGHLAANIDPLDAPRPQPTELDPGHYGFTEADLGRPFSTESFPDAPVLPLHKIIERLRAAYCGSVGVEYMHIHDGEARRWLRERLEQPTPSVSPPFEGGENGTPSVSPPYQGGENGFTREQQLRILERLTDASVFEDFLQRKFTGAKSFSLEGAATLIPLLDEALELAGEHGIEQVLLGMAHRGRLNVLANILRKPPREIFHDFQRIQDAAQTAPRDVPYHMGYSSQQTTRAQRKLSVTLCFNSSHLEFRAPVTLGRTRARQDRMGDTQRRRALTLLIHGDAAFSGEGIVQETLNLSELHAYRTGGTLHVIVNNQIGFTTPPSEGRSGVYATDVAKLLQSPIFHVNSADPETVIRVAKLAMEFRQVFQRDVFIDLYSYRRRGHNEGDEPSFTQPLMYRAIRQRKLIREEYLERLLRAGRVTRPEADAMFERVEERLDRELQASRDREQTGPVDTFNAIWGVYRGGREAEVQEVATGVDAKTLGRLLEAQTQFPPDFHPHPKLLRGLEHRRQMAQGQRPLDWAAAESLALATLAASGTRVRLTGQDTARGTFSQRHAVFFDVEDGRPYVPLQHLAEGQAPVEICNSPLSEAGVLGFEYGYSLDSPDALVLWEAQFGDFANAAQVVIDQFIVSGEHKWLSLSGLVLLLPHGFDGIGPEHSSARIERYLNLAADDNIQVINPTTPAQYFHCLRRQVLRSWRKPLILLTPKSLLRHPQCVSPLEELERGAFRRVIADSVAVPDKVRRVLLCSGKIYYELEAARAALSPDAQQETAIIRLEQLYPLPAADLKAALSAYPDGTRVFWVQEEPENMGAWRFLRTHFGDTLFGRLPFSGIYRPASASPASGSLHYHRLEQQQLVAEAFEGLAVIPRTPAVSPPFEEGENGRPLQPTRETLSHDHST